MDDGMTPITFTAARYVVSFVFLLVLRPLIKNNVHSEVDVQSRTVSSLTYSTNRMIIETFKWGKSVFQQGWYCLSIGLSPYDVHTHTQA